MKKKKKNHFNAIMYTIIRKLNARNDYKRKMKQGKKVTMLLYKFIEGLYLETCVWTKKGIEEVQKLQKRAGNTAIIRDKPS